MISAGFPWLTSKHDDTQCLVALACQGALSASPWQRDQRSFCFLLQRSAAFAAHIQTAFCIKARPLRAQELHHYHGMASKLTVALLCFPHLTYAAEYQQSPSSGIASLMHMQVVTSNGKRRAMTLYFTNRARSHFSLPNKAAYAKSLVPGFYIACCMFCLTLS